MGRMKELYTELQNEYGQNLEGAPENFSMENYLRQKSQELESLSNCCGSDLNKMITQNGPDYKDLGVCPDCGENI